MLNDETITILMATFNGEVYIKEQLDSLLNQTYNNIEIFVSDDGSTDRTIDIVQDYVKIDSRIHFEKSKHGGACKNFSNLLLKHKDSQYIMFCDQDDVWDIYKVQKSYELIRNYEKVPALVYCDKTFVDEGLNALEIKERNYSNSFKQILCQNHIYGCTMIINKQLIGLLTIPYFATMHDHWIALVAASYGVIEKLDETLIKYRQHNRNVTGGLKQFSIKNKILTWNLINKQLREENLMCYKFCKEFIRTSEKNSMRFAEMRNVCVSFCSIFENIGIKRLVAIIRFRYRKDHLLATIRGLFVIFSIKRLTESMVS